MSASAILIFQGSSALRGWCRAGFADIRGGVGTYFSSDGGPDSVLGPDEEFKRRDTRAALPPLVRNLVRLERI
jgi:hypothetical protein